MASDWLTLPPPSSGAYAWWISLLVLAGITTCLFIFVWWHTRNNACRCPENVKEYDCRWSLRYIRGMRLLAIPYVFECVYRSFFVAQYNSRRTFFDTSANQAIVNRSLAFVGEVCWVVQISWAMHILARWSPLRERILAKSTIRKIIPYVSSFTIVLAVVANVMSFLGMATTSNLYNIVEETLWFFIILFTWCCAIVLLYHSTDSGLLGDDDGDEIVNIFDSHAAPSTNIMRLFLRGMIGFGCLYLPYMAFFDIPKYYNRHMEEVANNAVFLTVGEGIKDAATVRVVTQDWEGVWRQEWVWMSFYFSTGAWSSILLMYAPGSMQTREGGENERGKDEAAVDQLIV